MLKYAISNLTSKEEIVSGKQYEDEDNDPQVIAAKAEARRIELEARAKLHPIAQVIYTLGDKTESLIGTIGCFIILIILVLAFFAPGVLGSLFGR